MSLLYPLKFKASEEMWVSGVAVQNVGQTPRGIRPHLSIYLSMEMGLLTSCGHFTFS